MSYLVFDIETIPDLAVWTPPAPEPEPAAAPAQPPPALPGQLSIVPPVGTAPPPDGAIVIPPAGQPAKKSRSRKKPAAPGEPAKEPFAPLYAHRVIAIGWTWLDIDSPTPILRGTGCVGTRAFGDDEAALLTAWDEFVRRANPTVVTFAGRGFEVPVLSLRSIRHGIAQAWADGEYRRRYGDRHIDLFEMVTDYGLIPRTGYSLDNMAQLIGLPPKGEVDGSQVKGMWMRGEVDKIEAYCNSDSVKTAFLLLRYKLMRGQLTRERYVAAARMLLEACVAQGLGNLAFGVDTKRLLLEG